MESEHLHLVNIKRESHSGLLPHSAMLDGGNPEATIVYCPIETHRMDRSLYLYAMGGEPEELTGVTCEAGVEQVQITGAPCATGFYECLTYEAYVIAPFTQAWTYNLTEMKIGSNETVVNHKFYERKAAFGTAARKNELLRQNPLHNLRRPLLP